jgi:hypothetical protein
MELFNTSTTEQAFKTSVRPLAVLFILQSIGLLFIFTSWPAEQLSKAPTPFIPDPIKKYFLIANALLLLIIGIGLFLRSRPIWFVFLGYLVLSPIWLISGIVFGYFPGAEPKALIIPLAAVFAIVVSLGLYFVTKPAFKKAS